MSRLFTIRFYGRLIDWFTLLNKEFSACKMVRVNQAINWRDMRSSAERCLLVRHFLSWCCGPTPLTLLLETIIWVLVSVDLFLESFGFDRCDRSRVIATWECSCGSNGDATVVEKPPSIVRHPVTLSATRTCVPAYHSLHVCVLPLNEGGTTQVI